MPTNFCFSFQPFPLTAQGSLWGPLTFTSVTSLGIILFSFASLSQRLLVLGSLPTSSHVSHTGQNSPEACTSLFFPATITLSSPWEVLCTVSCARACMCVCVCVCVTQNVARKRHTWEATEKAFLRTGNSWKLLICLRCFLCSFPPAVTTRAQAGWWSSLEPGDSSPRRITGRELCLFSADCRLKSRCRHPHLLTFLF